jgi:16S rRNA (guanine527-N7)-methyltransferase
MSVEDLPALVAEAVQVFPEPRRPADLEPLLCGFLGHLLERNREINLVSRRDTLEHLRRFTSECLFLARVLEEERPRRVGGPPRLLDIGSGNGFPGIVLKIALPDLVIQLVEGTRKKAKFLADVAAGLDLRDTSIVWARAESVALEPRTRGAFDWVTGKGLGTLAVSTELAAPFLQVGGVHWTFKGRACEREIEAAGGIFRQKGFRLRRREPIPGSQESYVVGVERLAPPGARRGAASPRP